MIALLKIYATGKTFGKIGLKAIRDTFFSNMWYKGKDRETQLFGGDDIQQKGKVQTFSLPGRPSPPILFLSATS